MTYVTTDHLDDNGSMTSEERRVQQKKELQELKKRDPGYHQLKRLNPNYDPNDGVFNHKTKKFETNQPKHVYIEIYGSGTQIRMASTGSYTRFLVGSVDEDNYFKVGISTGECGQESVTLFYNSPEEYENHHHTLLDQETKERWYKKNLAYRSQ
jgi:hypothetical protein